MKSRSVIPLIAALGLVAVMLALSACTKPTSRTVAPITPEYDAVALAGEAKGEVIVIGTLSTVGSFEYGNSSLVTIVKAAIRHVPQMLHDKELTADEAQTKINAAVHAESLLKSANATCKQNGAGKCTGNQRAAEQLVDQARAEIAQAGLGLN